MSIDFQPTSIIGNEWAFINNTFGFYFGFLLASLVDGLTENPQKTGYSTAYWRSPIYKRLHTTQVGKPIVFNEVTMDPQRLVNSAL